MAKEETPEKTEKLAGAIVSALTTIGGAIAGSPSGQPTKGSSKVDDKEEKAAIPTEKVKGDEEEKNIVKCGCDKDDCEDCKKRKINKETSDEYEVHIKSLYSHLPSRAVAEDAVQGCGTCDDYVAHLIRNEGMNTTQAFLKLQTALDGAFELSQKTVNSEEKKLPKETDGDPMAEKDEKEKAQKSLEDRLAVMEKTIADLQSAKKEGGGFAAPQIGGGAGPLVGIAGSTPENVDQTVMSTTKDVFAKSEEDAVVKLVKMGYEVKGFQKGVAQSVPPKGVSSPSGIDKDVVQKMQREMSAQERNIRGWAGKKEG